jgi:hypothetical protein
VTAGVGATSKQLWAVGASYGVIRLFKDQENGCPGGACIDGPHWSKTGN